MSPAQDALDTFAYLCLVAFRSRAKSLIFSGLMENRWQKVKILTSKQNAPKFAFSKETMNTFVQPGQTLPCR